MSEIDLSPRKTCQRKDCENASVYTPVFIITVEDLGEKTARSTMSFCEACRAFAIEMILPSIEGQAGLPFVLAGFNVVSVRSGLERIYPDTLALQSDQPPQAKGAS